MSDEKPDSIDDLLPQDVRIVSRIEIAEILLPSGAAEVVLWSRTSDGEGLDVTQFLGLLEHAKWKAMSKALATRT
ncbi:hypothetical protein TVH25_21300 [Rhodococcus sp. 7Tela_A2]|uniref:hypothetical protein n=1 Tax=Rhodococcus sp. 7Tela_A2 TaxID=3093744 RepID=UPI003BB5E2B1